MKRKILLLFIGLLGLGLLIPAYSVSAQGSAEFFFSKGAVAYSKGNFEEALEYFEKAAKLDPKHAGTRHYLGVTQTKLGKYKPAIENLKKALRLDPKIKELRYDLGVAYYKAEKYAEALNWFREAEKVQPERAMVYFYKGYIHYLMENYDSAAAPLNKAEELDPSLAQTCRFYRAMSLMKNKQYDEADQEFKAAVDADPKTDLAKTARTYRGRIPDLKQEAKPWSVVASLSMQFDDNVTVEPDEYTFSSRVADKEDYRTVFHLVGDYRFFKNEKWQGVSKYTYYESLHSSLHDYDIIQNQVNFNLTRRRLNLLGKPGTLGFDVDYSHTLMNEKPYLELVHFRSTVGSYFTPNHFFQLQWRFQWKDFHHIEHPGGWGWGEMAASSIPPHPSAFPPLRV